MFELEKQVAKLTAFAPKIGKRSGDKEQNPEADLSFTINVDNGFLSELHPSLKSAFYRKDDSPDAAEFQEMGNALTKLKFDDLIPVVAIKGKGVGMHVSIAYGVESEVSADNVTLKSIRVHMQEGATVIVSFVLTMELSGKDAGRVFESLLGNEVDVTLTKPTSPQATLIEE